MSFKLPTTRQLQEYGEELGMDLTPLKSVLRLPSDTWLFTGMVVLLLAGLDRLLLRSRIISH